MKIRANPGLITVYILVAACLTYNLGASAQALRSTEVSLYFLDTEELKLATERRTINQAANTVEQIRLTIVELVKGPFDFNRSRILPAVDSREKPASSLGIDREGALPRDVFPPLPPETCLMKPRNSLLLRPVVA